MDAVQHHMMIQKQIDEMTRDSLIAGLPKMKDIYIAKIQKNDKALYDTTWIDGEVLLKVICQDGLVVIVKVTE